MPRAVVDAEGWRHAIDHLTAGRCTLLGLWGDTAAVHIALIVEKSYIVVLTYACEDGRYPSVGAALRWHTRYARQNGVHFSPTFAVNRIVNPNMSSGQKIEEWATQLGL